MFTTFLLMMFFYAPILFFTLGIFSSIIAVLIIVDKTAKSIDKGQDEN